MQVSHIAINVKRIIKMGIEENNFKYVVMYGNEGCEGFLEIKTKKDLNCLPSMEMRARYNSQRNVGVYVFSSECELVPDDISFILLQNKKVRRVY